MKKTKSGVVQTVGGGAAGPTLCAAAFAAARACACVTPLAVDAACAALAAACASRS